MAPEGFSGYFFGGSCSDEVTEGVCTLAGDFRSLLRDVEWCFCVGMSFLKFGYRTSPNTGDISGQHVVPNVDWIWNFESSELDLLVVERIWIPHLSLKLNRLTMVLWHEL